MLFLGRSASSQSDEPEAQPSPEVLQALRLLLSPDPKDQDRGEAILKRMGPGAAPQLRYWIRKVESEVDRVRVFLEKHAGTPKGAPRASRITLDEHFHRKLLEARELGRAGDHQRALAIAEAILLLDPSSPHAWELRRLARRSRERIVFTEVLEPSLETERLVYEVGEETQAVFRLINHRDSDAVIDIQKGVLGEVDVSVTICHIDGSQKREQTRLRLKAPEDVQRIVLAPRKSWEKRIPVDLNAELPLSGAVGRVQIGGRFRPSSWRIDGDAEQGNLALLLSECEFWIVPPGESRHSENPLEKLAVAVLFKKVEPFFIGGQLGVWAAEGDAYFNEKLLATLIETLGDLEEERLKLAVRFLGELTGEDHGADAGKWQAWWARFEH